MEVRTSDGTGRVSATAGEDIKAGGRVRGDATGKMGSVTEGAENETSETSSKRPSFTAILGSSMELRLSAK